eukprot:3940745-Rhodomonas_salina.16
MPCPATSYAMPGTDTCSAPICLRACYAMSGTDFGRYQRQRFRRPPRYAPTPSSYAICPMALLAYRTLLHQVRYWHAVSCYAMPGTDSVYAATSTGLQQCGTPARGSTPYRPTRSYAMSGTDLRDPVLVPVDFTEYG